MNWVKAQVRWLKHLWNERYFGDLIGWVAIVYFVGWLIYGVVL